MMILDLLFAYSAQTDGMTVRVNPAFLPDQSNVRAGRWFWSYHIRIENHRDKPAQLLHRHWKITDGSGNISYVDGDGIVGEQPFIQPGGSYDYVSGCPLGTAFGEMKGQYAMMDDDGRFMIDIPRFLLKVDEDA